MVRLSLRKSSPHDLAMALTDVPLQEIREEHLARLISTQADESLYLEYKRETYGANDEQRKEFLADVSSFANAHGGDLILGMEAKRGVPIRCQPFTGDADAERQRLEAMARDGLQPRITGLQTRAIPLSTGGTVLIVRVPKSPLPPHRISFKNTNRFWARSSAGKFEPSVDELRQIFSAGPQRLDEIRAFHAERVNLISADGAPVPLLPERPLLILHVVPFAALDAGHVISPAALADKDRDFLPMGGTSQHWRAEFDGFVSLSNKDEDADQRAYVQIFWSGAVESVAALSEFREETLKLEGFIVRSAGWYAHALNDCGVPPPYAVLLSLVQAKGSLFIIHEQSSASPVTSTRDRYRFPDAQLATVPESDRDTAPALRPILDRLATLAGNSHTSTFDTEGNYLLKIPPPQWE
jgi:hypothetical protein